MRRAVEGGLYMLGTGGLKSQETRFAGRCGYGDVRRRGEAVESPAWFAFTFTWVFEAILILRAASKSCGGGGILHLDPRLSWSVR